MSSKREFPSDRDRRVALGAVLKTKYRLLRISYTVFMFGLAVGVISYLAVFFLAGYTAGGL